MSPLEQEIQRFREVRGAFMEKAEELSQRDNLTLEEQAVLDSHIGKVRDIDACLTACQASLDGGETQARGFRIPSAPGTGSRVDYGAYQPLSQRFGNKTMNTATNSNDSVLRSWFRLGSEVERVEDVRAVTSFGATATTLRSWASKTDPGSKAVPQTLLREFATLLEDNCDFLKFCRVFSTSTGEDLRLTVQADRDGANRLGSWIDENDPDADKDIAMSQVVLRSYSATSGIQKVSVELLQDENVNLSLLIGEALASRLGRLLTRDLTSGDGSGKPRGILHGVDQAGGVSSITSSASGAISVEDLVTLITTLDAVHQTSPNFRVMMAPTTYSNLLKLKDQSGRMLLAPQGELAQGDVGTILGKRVQLNAFMDEIGADKIAAIAGDFSQFAIRRVGDVILRKTAERYWESRQIAYSAFLRIDSAIIDPYAFQALKIKA